MVLALSLPTTPQDGHRHQRRKVQRQPEEKDNHDVSRAPIALIGSASNSTTADVPSKQAGTGRCHRSMQAGPSPSSMLAALQTPPEQAFPAGPGKLDSQMSSVASGTLPTRARAQLTQASAHVDESCRVRLSPTLESNQPSFLPTAPAICSMSLHFSSAVEKIPLFPPALF